MTTHVRRLHITLALVLLLACTLLAAVPAALAKYVHVDDRDAETLAAEFHVSSHLLQELPVSADPATTDGPNRLADYHLDTDGSTVVCEVDLLNYELANVAQVSEVDVQYRVTVEGGTLLRVQDAAGSPVDSNGDLYTLPKARDRDAATSPTKLAHTIVVQPADVAASTDVPAYPVTITVQTIAPYQKTFKARIGQGITAELEEYKAADAGQGVRHLLIHTNQYFGKLQVSYGSLTPFAPVNTGVYGWTIDTATQTATIANAQKQTTYTFELLSATNVQVRGNVVTVS